MIRDIKIIVSKSSICKQVPLSRGRKKQVCVLKKGLKLLSEEGHKLHAKGNRQLANGHAHEVRLKFNKVRFSVLSSRAIILQLENSQWNVFHIT